MEFFVLGEQLCGMEPTARIPVEAVADAKVRADQARSCDRVERGPEVNAKAKRSAVIQFLCDVLRIDEIRENWAHNAAISKAQVGKNE